MAIYHLNHSMLSRSKGRSAVENAAYITGETLFESRRNLKANYKDRKNSIVSSKTLAPEHAPAEFHNTGVWDLLETFEDEYRYRHYKTDATRDTYINSAQTAQTIVAALPKELSIDVACELIIQFALDRFVSRGLVVTVVVRDDESNPHAHLQVSRRAVNEKGAFEMAKDRDIATRKSLLETRKLWADLTNHYLEREGFDARVTEKSFAELRLPRTPSRKIGWRFHKIKRESQKEESITLKESF